MASERQRSTVESGELIFKCRSMNGEEQTGVVKNLGPGGLAVSLPEQPSPGDELEFRLVLGDKSISGRGRVVWAAGADGHAGMAFVHLNDYARGIIDLWLRQRGVLRRGT